MTSDPTLPTPDPGLERRWRTVEAKLAAHEDRLADQGSLVRMKSASGRLVWVVRLVERVDGRRVHRSVYVGTDDQPELLDRTRLWLDRCRVKGRVAREVEACTRLAVAACGVVRRLRPGIATARRGGPVGPTP